MANQYTAKTFISDTHKQCVDCKEIKEHSEFHKDKTAIRGKGLTYYCKVCANTRSRKHHAVHSKTQPEYKLNRKNSYIKQRYGISLQEYEIKLATQQVCTICGTFLKLNDPNVHLDHCHATGKIRDFLCGNCNRGLGSFKDNKEFLMNAIKYLEVHTENGTQKEGRCL